MTTGRRRSAAAVVAALVGVPLLGCGGGGAESAGPGVVEPTPRVASVPEVSTPDDCVVAPPERFEAEVVAERSHDRTAFTQGLVFLGGRLFESTGLRGASSLRELDPTTGSVLRQAPVPGDAFAEGLTVTADGRLVQLTWTEGVAFVRDPGTLEVVGEFRYPGEGWGLTTLDDGRLVQSDGSDTLVVRDPATFEPLEQLTVRRSGGSTDQLNELEWDGRHLWANRWRADEIVRIDLRCGTVDAVVDTSALAARVAAMPVPEGLAPPEVVNGVASIPGTDRFLVTGKRWPTMFEVRFVPT